MPPTLHLEAFPTYSSEKRWHWDFGKEWVLIVGNLRPRAAKVMGSDWCVESGVILKCGISASWARVWQWAWCYLLLVVSRHQHSAGPLEGTQIPLMLLGLSWSCRDEKAVPRTLLKSKQSSLFKTVTFMTFDSMEGSSGEGSRRGLDLGRNLVWFPPAGAPVWSHVVTCPLQPWWEQDRKITFHVRTKGPSEGDWGGGLLCLGEKWTSDPSAKWVERGARARRYVCLSCREPSGSSELVGLSAVSAPACTEATVILILNP